MAAVCLSVCNDGCSPAARLKSGSRTLSANKTKSCLRQGPVDLNRCSVLQTRDWIDRHMMALYQLMVQHTKSAPMAAHQSKVARL